MVGVPLVMSMNFDQELLLPSTVGSREDGQLMFPQTQKPVGVRNGGRRHSAGCLVENDVEFEASILQYKAARQHGGCGEYPLADIKTSSGFKFHGFNGVDANVELEMMKAQNNLGLPNGMAGGIHRPGRRHSAGELDSIDVVQSKSDFNFDRHLTLEQRLQHEALAAGSLGGVGANVSPLGVKSNDFATLLANNSNFGNAPIPPPPLQSNPAVGGGGRNVRSGRRHSTGDLTGDDLPDGDLAFIPTSPLPARPPAVRRRSSLLGNSDNKRDEKKPTKKATTIAKKSSNVGSGSGTSKGGKGGAASNLEKPRRSLSAYNIFFRYERAKLLGSTEPPDTSPSDRKRPHRKTHGKFSFRQLAKHCADKWKVISSSERSFFEEKAAVEREKYNKALEEYNQAVQAAAEQERKENEENGESDNGAASELVSMRRQSLGDIQDNIRDILKILDAHGGPVGGEQMFVPPLPSSAGNQLPSPCLSATNAGGVVAPSPSRRRKSLSDLKDNLRGILKTVETFDHNGVSSTHGMSAGAGAEANCPEVGTRQMMAAAGSCTYEETSAYVANSSNQSGDFRPRSVDAMMADDMKEMGSDDEIISMLNNIEWDPNDSSHHPTTATSSGVGVDVDDSEILNCFLE